MEDRQAPDHGAPTPADRLRARAEATDRSARFRQRLAEVEVVRDRRRRRRRLLRAVWVVVAAGVGAIVPIVVAAVVNGPDPTGRTMLVAAVVGAVVGVVGPWLRDVLAERRGAAAWDAYHERYVLIGDPSVQVRNADRPQQGHGDPPLPPERR